MTTLYRLTYWDGRPLEADVRYGDVSPALADALLWASALGALVEVRDHKDCRVGWVDCRGLA